jgi:Holliday junction DNA helicase RuvA
MIALITGEIVEKEEKSLVVMAGGVGYRVAVLPTLLGRALTSDQVTLRIHHHISDDNEALYGFESKDDLVCFELLLTVPSVGPRTAMAILEAAPPSVLEQAVAEEDIAVLTKVSGVGRKTAERILVELKEKIKAPLAPGVAGGVQQGAMEALVSIGYKTAQAREAVQRLPKDVKTVEEAVKAALRQK